MKFFTQLAFISTLVVGSFAQTSVRIGYPSDGASVSLGSELTVEVDKPNSLSAPTEVAIVIGLQSCANSPCHPPADGLGTVLYNGGYNPMVPPPSPVFKLPHQNFTVTIPSTFAKGKAQLGIAHVALRGAILSPFLETLNITLNLV